MSRSALILALIEKGNMRINVIFGLIFLWVFEEPSCLLSS